MILTYHDISIRSEHANCVDVEHFESQLVSLKHKKFVYLDDYNPFDENNIVIRFDDGYKGVLEYALPILKKYNLSFEVFVVGKFFEESETDNSIYLNKKELLEIVSGGGRLEYHSYSHLNLTEINELDKLENEIKPLKSLLSLDKNGFKYFAYPFWVFNKNVLSIVNKYYKGALTGRAMGDDSAYELTGIKITNFKKMIEDKPSKIAVQFFGHLRTYKSTYPSFKKNMLDRLMLENYDVDVFMHTWDEINSTTVKTMKFFDEIEKKEKILLTKEQIQNLKTYYKPKKLTIEPQLDYNDKIITKLASGGVASSKGFYNLAYTIYKSNEIRKEYEKENNINYDWVISTRPDVLFHTIFTIEKFLKRYEDFKAELSGNEYFYANCCPYGRDNYAEDIIFATTSDLIFFARPSSMNKALSLFKNFDNHVNFDRIFSFEHFILSYVEKQQIKPIPIRYFQFNDFDILKEEIKQPVELNNNNISTNVVTEVPDELGLRSNWLPSMFAIFNTKDRLTFVIFFINITIKVTEKDINKISWWIPIRILRDKFRAKFN